MSGSLFDKPVGDWTDPELAAARRVLVSRLSEPFPGPCGDAQRVMVFRLVCAVVDAQEARSRLYREMVAALAYASPSSLAELGDGWLPDDDGDDG